MQPKKILIIKPSSLGDIIHSLPVLNSLRQCFAQSEIHWVVAKNFAQLLEGHPMINKLWVINKDIWKNPFRILSTIKDFFNLGRRLKAERYDLVIDLQGLLRSGIISFLTGSTMRIGFKEAREGSTLFYTHRVKGGKDVHAVDRYLKVLSLIDCPVREIVFPLPVSEVRLEVPFPAEYAVLVPGARWLTKRWPPQRFAEIAKRLPFKSLIVGSRDDIPLAEEIINSSEGKAISLCGKTDLRGLVEVIRRARLVVSNDSGPMHIAAAFGIPTFAIFGPTSELRTGPYGKNVFVVRAKIECAPCFKRRCKKKLCMESVTVEDVWAVISNYLNL